MISQLFKSTALTVLSLSGTYLAHAQTFVPPVAHEQVYNNWNITHSSDISCFSFHNSITPTAWGEVDVYLAGFGSGFGEVTVQFTKPGDPTTVVYKGNLSGLQGNYNYQDGSYLQVGAVYNESTGTMQVLVAYQWAGFKVDIFDITNSPTDPVVYNSTINLTPLFPYTNYFDHRIRMDCDRELGRVAIIWDNPNVGLQTIACTNGNWGNIMDIDGTAGEAGPDIAMALIGGDAYLHYVHHDASGTVITKSTLVFDELMNPLVTTVYPAIEDVNLLSTPLNSNLVIDSRGEENAKNWAYTYTDQNALEVFVRLVENNSGTLPTTFSVNTGVLGNASIYGQYNVYSPSLNYGARVGGKDEITVGWYNTDGSYNGYIGLIMRPDGSGLLSNADYLEMPNAFTASPYTNVAKSGIAFSKCDAENTANRHLYTVYYDYESSISGDQLHHAYHRRGLTVFNEEKMLDLSAAKIYPNPFSDVLNTSVTLKENATVRLDLLDIAGRVVKQQEIKAETGTYPVHMSGLADIVPGTYFLKTSIAGKAVTTKTVIKK